MAEISLLDRLDGLDARFEEVSTLITDPSVIADQKRYVRLSKEYHDLEVIIKAKDEYKSKLDAITESKEILAVEDDEEMKALAKEELDSASAALPELEERIKLLLIPADPDDAKNAVVEIRGGTGGDGLLSSPATFSACIRNMQKPKGGSYPYRLSPKALQEGIRRLSSISRDPMYTGR